MQKLLFRWPINTKTENLKMCALIRHSKLISLFLALTFLTTYAQAQALTVSITPNIQCFSNSSSNTVTVFVTTAPGSVVTTYSWSAVGSSCTPTFTNVVGNGSVIAATYPCCGSYTFYCTALNVSAYVTSGTAFSNILCSPNVSVSGSATLCAGSSTTLTASGAQTYTWSNGAIGNSVIITPSVSTGYSVVGGIPSGCTDSTSYTINVTPFVSASYTYTTLPNGSVVFNNTSTNTTTNTTYFWDFGNGTTSSSLSPSATYTANGIYTATLTANSGCGPSTYTQTININNIVVSCAASFTYQTGTNGNYTFSSTSAGTSTQTTYAWNFGNGTTYSASGSAGINPPVQTYTAGTYSIILTISNTNPVCNSSVAVTINVCLLTPNFSFVQNSGNTINFSNTSTGTLSGSTYTWNYGDGTISTNINGMRTYSSTGQYFVTLSVHNTSLCFSSITKTVAVSACNLVSNFTHTALTNGAVNFSSSSSTLTGTTKYYWNFGDGIYSLASSPSHTYTNAGTYLVTLKLQDTTFLSCFDSLTQSINVTGVACVANANFSIVPTPTLQYWTAVLDYPYNITAATWYWGDGSQDNTLYASHLYSVAANYSICLHVTVSCGATSYTCFSNSLNKSANDPIEIISVDVLRPEMSTGILNTLVDNLSYQVFPNPSSGIINLSVNNKEAKDLTITVCSLLGETVYYSREDRFQGELTKQIDLSHFANGIYFIKVAENNKSYTKKIILHK